MSASTSRRYPAELLGIGIPETLRKWWRQAEVDARAWPGVTGEDSAELKRLKGKNAELKRANAILKAVSVFFAANSTGHCTDRRVGLLRWCSLERRSRAGRDAPSDGPPVGRVRIGQR